MNVLVVAAHPDDEVLGCGATVAKHVKDGDCVRVVILAEGVTGRDKRRSRTRRAGTLSRLARAARRANAILGVESVTLHQFGDNRMDAYDLLDVVKVVEKHVNAFSPDVVYTHYPADLNVDHAITSRAVVTACRPVPGHSARTILFFEVASSTEWMPPAAGTPFAPTWFVDVSGVLSLKLRALRAYNAEIRPWPHARSVRALEHLARWRGATVGVAAAEAFVLGRLTR